MGRALVGLVCVLTVVGLGSCGGGGGGGGGPMTVTLISQAGLDGYCTDTRILNTAGMLQVGDRDQWLAGANMRSFVSFSMAPIPVGATINAATLRCFQGAATGTPYLDLSHIVVDYVDYGTSLDNDEYGLTPIVVDMGTLSVNDTQEWKTVDVTNAVGDAVTAAQPRCQFRLRFVFETLDDGQNDWAEFESSDNTLGTGNRPELVVTYTP